MRDTLKSLREKTGLYQTEISIRTKNTRKYIPQSSLSDWERGNHVPDADALLVLRDLYICSNEEILSAWENTPKNYE